jgi:O-antigen/teichoic acid export membrane protein
MSIKKLLKDSFIYGISNTLNKLFLVILVPVYTRILTQAEFGALDLILANLKILVVLLGLLINTGIARFFYEARDKGEEKRLIATGFWALWVLPVLFSSGIILYRKPITLYLFHLEQYIEWVMLAALIIPLMVLFFYTLVLFRIRDEKGCFVGFSFLNLGTSSLLALLLVWKFNWGVAGILVGQLTGLILGLGGSLWTLGYYLKPEISRHWLKELLFFGVPQLPAVVGNWGQSYGNRFLINAYMGLNSVGLYSLAVNVGGIIMFAEQAFILAWGPHSNWLIGQEGCENIFRRILNIYAWAMGSLVLAIILYSQEIVRLFGPPSYQEAARYVGFIVLALVLNGCTNILAMGIYIAKKTYWIGVAYLIGMACNLLGLYLTLSKFGLAAAAIWFAFGTIISNILLLWTSQRNHWIPYNYKRYAFFVLFLLSVALWSLLSPLTMPFSPSALLVKAMLLGIGVVALAYALLDTKDRRKGLDLVFSISRLRG